MLLESWKSYEQEFGNESAQQRVAKLMPERVKKRRKLQAEDGVRPISAYGSDLAFSINENFQSQCYFITITHYYLSARDEQTEPELSKSLFCRKLKQFAI